MIRCAVSNSLRKKLMGEGNVYFYHATGKDADTWQWAPGRQTALQSKGKLGYLQIIQNELANLLEAYLEHMVAVSRRILYENVSSPVRWNLHGPSINFMRYLATGHGYSSAERDAVAQAKEEGTAPPTHNPLAINYQYFSGVTKRGKVIQGSFGNHSPHAIYVEWGTGPVGKKYSSKISRAMKERKGMPTYATEPWTYFNYAVGHLVKTSGMPPRPFVYPAFLRLRSSFVNDCKAVLRGLHKAYFLQSAAVEASFIENKED